MEVIQTTSIYLSLYAPEAVPADLTAETLELSDSAVRKAAVVAHSLRTLKKLRDTFFQNKWEKKINLCFEDVKKYTENRCFSS